MTSPSFTNNDVSNEYTVNVKNKFDFIEETSKRHTPNNEYENFATAQLEATVEYIPTKSRVKCWVPWESLLVRKERYNF